MPGAGAFQIAYRAEAAVPCAGAFPISYCAEATLPRAGAFPISYCAEATMPLAEASKLPIPQRPACLTLGLPNCLSHGGRRALPGFQIAYCAEAANPRTGEIPFAYCA
jgi:hypothetical protein